MSLSVSYLVYLAISVVATAWVAHVLHRRGRVFLIDCMQGNEHLADTSNDLLVVGYYLINLAYVTLAMKYGTKPTNLVESVEFLSSKIGLVLLLMGVMHFVVLAVCTRLGKRIPIDPSRQNQSNAQQN